MKYEYIVDGTDDIDADDAAIDDETDDVPADATCNELCLCNASVLSTGNKKDVFYYMCDGGRDYT